MLSSRPVQLTTDAPYFMSKTPGRAFAHRGENVHAGALSVNPNKGKNNGVPRTPFQPASTLRQKKPGLTTTSRLLADKTPLPNRIGAILFQTPLPQKQNAKSSKLLFADPDALNQTKSVKKGGGKTPDSIQRPSSTRKHVKHPCSAAQNFETPMNRGNHWDISDGDIVLPADVQPVPQDTNDDLDEIEFMAPNTLNLPYEPQVDFELPDYKVLGKELRHLAYTCPYDDSTSPLELDIVVSDMATSTWDMLKLPPLSLEDDPFHQARAELTQAPGKTSAAAIKTRVVTKTGPQPSLARQPISHNPVPLSIRTRNISQPQRALPLVNIESPRPEAAGTATTVKGKGTTSKSVPPSTGINPKGNATATGTTAIKGVPVKSTYHKSTVSLSSAGVVARAAVRRPHTVLDINKKRDKLVGVHGALMLVKDLHIKGDVVGEDFLFDV